jgi:SAM-dependent methyltransferase
MTEGAPRSVPETLGELGPVAAAWLHYLHRLRTREFDLIFGRCPPSLFDNGLELGAGDGHQSRLLSRHVRRLMSTDFAEAPPAREPCAGVKYRRCDAEEVDEHFGAQEFDLVYSSNLLEHLPDPARALRAIHRILKDDGVAVHVVPNSFWKASHLAGFYPDLAAKTVRALFTPGFLRRFVARRLRPRQGTEVGQPSPLPTNNPKMPARRERLLWPIPHGAYRSNVQEFYALSKRRWLREFDAAGFAVAKVLRGPVTSGYGFGLDRLRLGLERAGFASEYVYITVKRGRVSPFVAYF